MNSFEVVVSVIGAVAIAFVGTFFGLSFSCFLHSSSRSISIADWITELSGLEAHGSKLKLLTWSHIWLCVHDFSLFVFFEKIAGSVFLSLMRLLGMSAQQRFYIEMTCIAIGAVCMLIQKKLDSDRERREQQKRRKGGTSSSSNSELFSTLGVMLIFCGLFSYGEEIVFKWFYWVIKFWWFDAIWMLLILPRDRRQRFRLANQFIFEFAAVNLNFIVWIFPTFYFIHQERVCSSFSWIFLLGWDLKINFKTDDLVRIVLAAWWCHGVLCVQFSFLVSVSVLFFSFYFLLNHCFAATKLTVVDSDKVANLQSITNSRVICCQKVVNLDQIAIRFYQSFISSCSITVRIVLSVSSSLPRSAMARIEGLVDEREIFSCNWRAKISSARSSRRPSNGCEE